MIYLGKFKAGDTVFYAANFHNDTGTIENPTSPEAQIRNSAGTWSALTAPAIQNSKIGHYGGTIDTTGYSVGQHVIRMAGIVATAKTVATEFCFAIVANIESDIYGKVDTEIADIQSRLPSALTANGNMKSSLVEILTTALTETAGQIAAAFKQFFDVGTPTGTMKAITNVVTATNLTTNNDKTGYSINGTKTTLDALNDVSTAQVNAEVDTALADANLDHLAGTATAIPAIPAGTYIDQMMDDGTAVYDRTTDSLQAVRDRGDSAWTTGAGGSDRLLMVDTTIATLASQTSFTLTAGSADNNAYLNCTIVIEDAATATQKAVGLISAYTGATKTVTLKYDPAIFTMAATDKVYILAENSLKSTAQNRQLDVTATGAAGIDWGNVENPTTVVDLSATDIQLCDTTTTNTDMRGTNSAALASVCTETRLSELDAGTGGKMANQVDIIEVDTTSLN